MNIFKKWNRLLYSIIARNFHIYSYPSSIQRGIYITCCIFRQILVLYHTILLQFRPRYFPSIPQVYFCWTISTQMFEAGRSTMVFIFSTRHKTTKVQLTWNQVGHLMADTAWFSPFVSSISKYNLSKRRLATLVLPFVLISEQVINKMTHNLASILLHLNSLLAVIHRHFEHYI